MIEVASIQNDSIKDVTKNDIVREFKGWVADQIMVGRINYPDQDTLNEFLESYFPSYRGYSYKLWDIYLT